jgi:hypothetical protein
MSRRSVGIDRLTVRLRGVSAASARRAASGLGPGLLRELVSRQPQGGQPRTGRIDRVDSGEVPLAAGATANDLQQTMVGRIADAIHPTRK